MLAIGSRLLFVHVGTVVCQSHMNKQQSLLPASLPDLPCRSGRKQGEQQEDHRQVPCLLEWLHLQAVAILTSFESYVDSWSAAVARMDIGRTARNWCLNQQQTKPCNR